MKKIWDGITGKYREVEVGADRYRENIVDLWRIETKGRTGKKMYINPSYINIDGKEIPPYGMGGSTGHGWGGQIRGYVTMKEALERNIDKYV